MNFTNFLSLLSYFNKVLQNFWRTLYTFAKQMTYSNWKYINAGKAVKYYWNWLLVLISSTFYTRIFHTKVFSLHRDCLWTNFCTKNAHIKRCWNWLLLYIWIYLFLHRTNVVADIASVTRVLQPALFQVKLLFLTLIKKCKN